MYRNITKWKQNEFFRQPYHSVNSPFRLVPFTLLSVPKIWWYMYVIYFAGYFLVYQVV